VPLSALQVKTICRSCSHPRFQFSDEDELTMEAATGDIQADA